MATFSLSCGRTGEESIQICQNPIDELCDIISHSTPLLYRLAILRVGNNADAEDALQDAFLSAFTHLHQFKGKAKMSTWLTAIVINSSLTVVRRRARKGYLVVEEVEENPTPLLERLADDRPNPEELYQGLEVMEQLLSYVERLSPVLRRTFELRDLHCLSTDETAKILGVPQNVVKTRLARARCKLRAYLSEIDASAIFTRMSQQRKTRSADWLGS